MGARGVAYVSGPVVRWARERAELESAVALAIFYRVSPIILNENRTATHGNELANTIALRYKVGRLGQFASRARANVTEMSR
jgi:hypothetical protein